MATASTRRTVSTPSARNARVVQAAGTDGHVLTPAMLPARQPLRTDLVDPVVAFVAYGVPAGQGSKRPLPGGRLKEQSAYVQPWRQAVRRVARRAIADHERRTGQRWVALNEGVVISAVVTTPATDAATRRGDIYSLGSPDLDKLQRAIGDAISPQPLSLGDGKGLPEAARKRVREELMAQRRRVSVLHDDARIVGWEHVAKVYPARTVDALGFSGVVVQVWRVEELLAAQAAPLVRDRAGVCHIRVDDVLGWGTHDSGESWQVVAQRLWRDPQQVLAAADRPLRMRWRVYGDEALRVTLANLATRGPQARMRVMQDGT